MEYINIITTLMDTGEILSLAAIIGMLGAVFKLYRSIDERIDERIHKLTQPTVQLLQETVEVVKSLEKNTAEMNATLSILKDILLSHKILDK